MVQTARRAINFGNIERVLNPPFSGCQHKDPDSNQHYRNQLVSERRLEHEPGFSVDYSSNGAVVA